MKDHATQRLRRFASAFSTDPGILGIQLLASSAIWLAYAAFLTLVVRWQQTWPWTEPPLVGRLFFAPWGGQLTPEFFSWLETARDSTAVFFVALPCMVGVVGNLVLPQAIGARHRTWGRWNRASFWMLWLAFGWQLAAFFLAGWTSPGSRAAQLASLAATSLAALAFLVMAICQLVTVMQLRRQGLTFPKLPLVVWGLLMTNSFLCVAIPIFLITLAMQLGDAVAGTSFLALSEFVPRSTDSGTQRAVQSFHAVLSFRHIAVTYLLLLPGLGLVCDQLRGRRQESREIDRMTRYAMLAIAGLALASWLRASPALGGNWLSAFGSPLLPTRLITLPLAVVIGGLVVAARVQPGRPGGASAFAWAFVLTLTTGAFMSVLLSAQPLGNYLQATFAADAHWCCLMLFAPLLAIWVVMYDRLSRLSGQRLVQVVGRLHCLLTCAGLQAAWWIWFALGVAGLPVAVADLRQFEIASSAFAVQSLLTALLAMLFGVQLLAALSLLACWLRARVAK